MTDAPDPRRTVPRSMPGASPVRHEGCDAEIANGHGGTAPLPIMRIPDGFQSAWRFSSQAMKALRRNGGGISLVITTGPNGTPEISIAVPQIILTKSARH